MDVRITVIIPTVGRDTLPRALASCAGADEILVVVDRSKVPSDRWPDWPANVRIFDVGSCDRGGHSSRNAAMPQATGTHLCFLDDDDVFLPGAIETMRAAACDRPVIFKMDHPEHGILWRDQAVTFGNVSTQMFLVPNDPARLGVWAPHAPGLPQPGGDFTFITGCVEKMGQPVWRDELTACYRPDFPTIAIVTPWIDHEDLLPDYMAAVARRSHRDELIVVDNGSQSPLPFPGIRFEDNRGFNPACNAGLHAARTDAVLFLNNDITLTRPDWLTEIRNRLQPGILVGELRHDQHTQVDGQIVPYLDGWCLAGMRDDLLALGGWDESLMEPAYYGDNILSVRARLAGMDLVDMRVGLRHRGNVTSNGSAHAATEHNRARYVAEVRRALAVAA